MLIPRLSTNPSLDGKNTCEAESKLGLHGDEWGLNNNEHAAADLGDTHRLT